MQTLALIDYESGNTHSARRALDAAASAIELDFDIHLTADPKRVASADRIVLPGVGHFAQCRDALAARPELIPAMEYAVLEKERPFLGICVGMQLMADFGTEDGETAGLGWIHGRVNAIDPGPGHAVPHMGWNELSFRRPHPILADLGPDPHAYFVHAYSFSPEDDSVIRARCEYGHPIVAAVGQDNLFGTQFHPEKSQRVGLQLLSNFLRWTP